jgi:hypothetical protein
MKNDQDNHLTPQEAAAYRSLPKQAAPPPALENQIVNALHRKGLLRREGKSFRPRLRTMFLVAAPSLASLLLGVFLGSWLWPAEQVSLNPTSPLPRFLLLLRNPADTFQSDIPPEKLRAEYAAWAGRLAETGAFLQGEELEDRHRLLTASSVESGADRLAPSGPVSGYFLIQARDSEEAAQIARECPHLGYGGAIELRALVEAPSTNKQQ